MLLYVLTAALLCASSIRAQQSITFSAPDTLNTVGCTGGNSWTKWFNEMKPTATQMDEETHTTLVSKYGRDVCAKHNGIQAQSVGPLAAGVSYSGSWKTMNNVITAFTSATAGLDFQVRFCCANTDFTPTTTTTTTPRPLPNASCGRAEIKASLQTSRIFGGSLAVANSWPWVRFSLSEIRFSTLALSLLFFHHLASTLPGNESMRYQPNLHRQLWRHPSQSQIRSHSCSLCRNHQWILHRHHCWC